MYRINNAQKRASIFPCILRGPFYSPLFDYRGPQSQENSGWSNGEMRGRKTQRQIMVSVGADMLDKSGYRRMEPQLVGSTKTKTSAHIEIASTAV